MKTVRICLIVLSVISFFSFSACAKEEPVILHCDRCGKEIEYPADTDMTDDWLIVCPDCQKEIYP